MDTRNHSELFRGRPKRRENQGVATDRPATAIAAQDAQQVAFRVEPARATSLLRTHSRYLAEISNLLCGLDFGERSSSSLDVCHVWT